MEVKNRKILEALQMQPLSEEEMTARHILGRMYGPIASCVESTRNTRLYNRDLWENALQDEILLEKVATKALFLELGHPADREETDMRQTCACIPEVPKIVGDDLCAYVDILDTPNGRLLKTLVDYGFVPGISSRGSGDVMENNQVDPETFFLETWDIVQLPAVKKARLNMCESLDSNGVKLKKALAESYKAAKEEDKDTMKKALENLNIDINEALEDDTASDIEISNTAYSDEEKHLAKNIAADKEIAVEAKEIKLITDPADIPWAEDEENVLMEEMPADEESEETEQSVEEPAVAEEIPDEPVEELAEVEAEEDSNKETSEEAEEKAEVDVEEYEEMDDLDTVGDAIEMLQEFDDDVKIELEPINIDGEQYDVKAFTSFIDDEGDTDILVLGVNCEKAEENSDDTDENIEQETEEETSVETIEEVEETEEVEDDEKSADDDGDSEVIESLKEMVRQKEALEAEVSELRKAKSVGDAKEKELQESLLCYKTALKKTKTEAANVVSKLESKVKELTEKLTQSQNDVKVLTETVNKAQQLKESLNGSKDKEKKLTEEVSKLTKQSKTLEAKLEGQTKVYTEKLQERTNLAKSYKARFIETLNKYVESKASLLGIAPSEITSRLNESYTLKDVDAVCEQILDSAVNFSRLPFGGRTKTSARIAESVTKPVRRDPEYGYEIDDSLYELAGLKK